MPKDERRGPTFRTYFFPYTPEKWTDKISKTFYQNHYFQGEVFCLNCDSEAFFNSVVDLLAFYNEHKQCKKS